MRILGLDPGSVHTGYGVLQKAGSKLAALAVGRISSPRAKPVADRLAYLQTEIDSILERWQPDTVVLESLFHGPNARSLIVLAQARGVLLASCAKREVVIREYSPSEVKSAVTGSGRATKEQVARMVGMLLKLDAEPLTADATDALAVGICGSRRSVMDGLGGASKRASTR